jgi:hypothetical protein
MSDSTYDGTCGIPSPFATRDGLHLLCKFEPGHGGDHDWVKYKGQFYLHFGVTYEEMVARRHPVPEHCCCTPVREIPDGRIVEYIFSPNCVPHSRKRDQAV